MSNTARITIDLALPEGLVIDQHILDALEALADVMLVQAEDGLWSHGSPDAEESEFVQDWGYYDNDNRTNYGSSIAIVNLDKAGIASRQTYIETGTFLTVEEAREAAAGTVTRVPVDWEV